MKTFITTTIVTLTLATAAWAQPFNRGGGEGDGPRGKGFAAVQETLELTDDQVEGLKANNQAMREEMRTTFQSTREKREQLKAELESENPNAAIIGQLMIEARTVRDEMKAVRDKYRESALALLDDAQKAKLATLQQALEMAGPARAAIGLNLLEGPGDGPGFGGGSFRGGSPFGPGGRGPRGGGPGGR